MYSAPLQAHQYRSEIDNFEIELPDELYPVNLSYEQNTALGMVQVKSISFHSNLAKFLIEVVDYPVTDQRSAESRMNAKLVQLKSHPDRQLQQTDRFLSDTTPGLMIKSVVREQPEIVAIFVDKGREYHISSESFETENLPQVMLQTEVLVRSFKLINL